MVLNFKLLFYLKILLDLLTYRMFINELIQICIKVSINSKLLTQKKRKEFIEIALFVSFNFKSAL